LHIKFLSFLYIEKIYYNLISLKILVIIFLTGLVTNLYSQEPAHLLQSKDSSSFEYNFKPEYNPIKRFGKDLYSQLMSPFRMEGSDYVWFGTGSLITVGLVATDQSSYNYISKSKDRSKTLKKTSPFITNFGGNYGLISLAAFAGYSLIFNDRKAQETSYLAAESFLTSSVWIVSMKWMVGRERPSAHNVSGSSAGGKWSGPLAYFRNNPRKSVSFFDAFPSGHTATAFSIATVIAKQYDNTFYAPLLSYTAASLVGISRIAESTHWASDVFVGAIIGYLTATQVVHNNPSEYTRDKTSKEISHSKIKTHFSLGMYESSPALVFNATF
jgi:membrane-associated phospholipid phosphatase